MIFYFNNNPSCILGSWKGGSTPLWEGDPGPSGGQGVPEVKKNGKNGKRKKEKKKRRMKKKEIRGKKKRKERKRGKENKVEWSCLISDQIVFESALEAKVWTPEQKLDTLKKEGSTKGQGAQLWGPEGACHFSPQPWFLAKWFLYLVKHNHIW